jgi:uncharacterized protein
MNLSNQSSMKIWVDGDACPAVIKDIIYKAAQRTGIETTFVANQPFRIPESPHIKFLLVKQGFDVADEEIVKLTQANDLVITADIPLAALAIEKGSLALNPRGELYTQDTIAARLSMRNFMDSIRSSGVETGGPAPMNKNDRHLFANSLNTVLNSR